MPGSRPNTPADPVKLTSAQHRALKRLHVGAYYPAGSDVRTCGALVRRGLAEEKVGFGSYVITPAGRALLARLQQQGEPS